MSGRGGSVVRGGRAVRGGWRAVRGGIVGSLGRGWGGAGRRVVRDERRGGDDTPFDPNLEEETSSETYSAGDSEEEKESSSSKNHRGAKLLLPLADNSKSVGGRLKEVGKVIETFQQYEKISMNVNCPLETFGRVLGKFDETKTQIVRDMGFGTLFYAVGKRLPRQLAYWLCTRVHWVLDLPHGQRLIPTKVVDQEVEDSLWIKYRTINNSETEGITRKTLIEALEAPSAVASSAKLYNWCSLILDELLHAMASFAKRFYNNGFAHGSGGCTLFLLLMYLDRLNKISLEWNEFLRLKCLDVSYGGDAGHPLKAKDCFLAKRKREEADEVVADIDDEDLAWLTIDVKTRRTLVKEEYSFQRKKKKIGEKETKKEPDLDKELEKKLEKEPDLEKELEKEPEKEPNLEKENEKELGLEKEPKKEPDLDKELEKKPEKEPHLEKELEKEPEKEPDLEKDLRRS
uniref:Uncharacterized protein n=1 Tax=Chenopodium quinoa TaxID=63459 RepID=A0A803N6D2_CHEQI